MEWIDCKDKMPEKFEVEHPAGYRESKWVVVISSNWACPVVSKHQHGETNEGRQWSQWFDITGGYELQGVTHWMPLPEPPKNSLAQCNDKQK